MSLLGCDGSDWGQSSYKMLHVPVGIWVQECACIYATYKYVYICAYVYMSFDGYPRPGLHMFLSMTTVQQQSRRQNLNEKIWARTMRSNLSPTKTKHKNRPIQQLQKKIQRGNRKRGGEGEGEGGPRVSGRDTNKKFGGLCKYLPS